MYIQSVRGDRLRAERCSLPHRTYTAPYMDVNARGGIRYNRHIYTVYIRTANFITHTLKRIRSAVLKGTSRWMKTNGIHLDPTVLP